MSLDPEVTRGQCPAATPVGMFHYRSQKVIARNLSLHTAKIGSVCRRKGKEMSHYSVVLAYAERLLTFMYQSPTHTSSRTIKTCLRKNDTDSALKRSTNSQEIAEFYIGLTLFCRRFLEGFCHLFWDGICTQGSTRFPMPNVACAIPLLAQTPCPHNSYTKFARTNPLLAQILCLHNALRNEVTKG